MSETVHAISSAKFAGMPLAEIAKSTGTPVYVYNAEEIQDRYTKLDHAFGDYPHRIHYALKANSTLAISRLICALGGRVDANSGGEIEVARRAGFGPEDIVFTGVGKSQAELELAVGLGLYAINAESRGELERIEEIASDREVRPRVALRVNPDIVADTHPNISTGESSHKFGVSLDEAGKICRWAAKRKALRLTGLHVHIGSQLLDLDPLRRASESIAIFADQLAADGVQLEHLDLGGGLGISYDGVKVVSADEYAATILGTISSTGLSVVVEPGRWIVGPAGVLVARVVDVKPRGKDRWFVVLDAGMSELIRPALYGAYHRIDLVQPRDLVPVPCDIVGPICETSDVFGTDRMMPLPEVGDLVVVRDAGAYGSAMSSNYNRHSLPVEVMVYSSHWEIIRRRQSVEDMLLLET